MKRLNSYIALPTLLCIGLTTACGQILSVHGQVSGWTSLNPDNAQVAQSGLRYVPELSIGKGLDNDLSADIDLSLNGVGSASSVKNQHPEYEGSIKPYRASFRLSSNRFEIRAGLQKINFGSATLFRPLMWFDRVDPRDPLQLTDGVYALLARYYFADNANVWLWGLYGNNETKGWEIVPTPKRTVEYGGRLQIPASTGEIGVTYHHRVANLAGLPGFPVGRMADQIPENRYALDGKWDVGVGVWFEAVLVHQQTEFPGLKYQLQWTVGADYTFDVGNGLDILTEYFRSENPANAFGPATGIGFSAWSLNYPLGLVDRISGILYRDWTNREWYRFASWQRTYDDWALYFIGFWNPDILQLNGNQGVGSTFAGKGIQLMVVFNH
jgi:hypothetical protein